MAEIEYNFFSIDNNCSLADFKKLLLKTFNPGKNLKKYWAIGNFYFPWKVSEQVVTCKKTWKKVDNWAAVNQVLKCFSVHCINCRQHNSDRDETTVRQIATVNYYHLYYHS